MAVTQKVTLYNNKFTVPPVINAVQNDTDRLIEAYFGDFTLQVGMTGVLSFIRSDRTHYEVSATLDPATNTATAELDQALTQAGVTQAQLKITDSGNVGSTFTFMIKVQPDVAGISQQQDGWSAQEFDQRLTDAENAIDTVEEDVADLQEKEYDYAPVITDTASGSIASFPDGADGYQLKECVVNIEAVQSGSGDPSPDNVRPISGWSEAEVTRTGKNLLPMTVSGIKSYNTGTWVGNSLTENGITFTIQTDGSGFVTGIALSGTATAQKSFVLNQGENIKAEQSIVNGIGAGASNTSHFLNFEYSDGTNVNILGDTTITNKVINKTQIYIRNGQNVDGVVYRPMLRLASEADATYEPYNGQTFTIDLDGTRYGGTLDVRRGKLRVDMIETVFAGVVNDVITGWYVHTPVGSADGRLVLRMANKPHKASGNNNAINQWAMSDKFKKDSFNAITGVNAPEYSFAPQENWDTAIIIYVPNKTTVEEYLAWFAENPTEIAYKLATPIEVDVDPEAITTLLGINNLWADCGNIEVEYCADTKRYIQKLISQLA